MAVKDRMAEVESWTLASVQGGMRSFLFGLAILSMSLVLLAQPANAQCPPGNVSVEAQHQALSRRAMAAAERGQLAEALRFSREMLILCPTDHRARYAAAYAGFRLGLEVQASRDSLECMRSTDPVIGCWPVLRQTLPPRWHGFDNLPPSGGAPHCAWEWHSHPRLPSGCIGRRGRIVERGCDGGG